MARERLENPVRGCGFDPKGAENRPHNNNYKTDPYPKQDTVIASTECSGGGEGPAPSRQKPEKKRKLPERGIDAWDRAGRTGEAGAEVEILPTGPAANLARNRRRRGVPASDLGVSKSLWGEACAAMGRERRRSPSPSSRPRSRRISGPRRRVFPRHGDQSQSREFNLDRTVWAWRRGLQPAPNGAGEETTIIVPAGSRDLAIGASFGYSGRRMNSRTSTSPARCRKLQGASPGAAVHLAKAAPASGPIAPAVLPTAALDDRIVIVGTAGSGKTYTAKGFCRAAARCRSPGYDCRSPWCLVGITCRGGG